MLSGKGESPALSVKSNSNSSSKDFPLLTRSYTSVKEPSSATVTAELNQYRRRRASSGSLLLDKINYDESSTNTRWQDTASNYSGVNGVKEIDMKVVPDNISDPCRNTEVLKRFEDLLERNTEENMTPLILESTGEVQKNYTDFIPPSECHTYSSDGIILNSKTLPRRLDFDFDSDFRPGAPNGVISAH